MNKYDYIIIGAGCAGLSLLMRMMRSGALNNRSLLLVDKSPKRSNDRTWCFWEQQPGFFEEVVCKKWDQLSFASPGFSGPLQIRPYQYKMIRSLDFYNYCFEEIGRHPNVDVVYWELSNWYKKDGVVVLETSEGEKRFPSAVAFNSIYPAPRKKGNRHYLLQHFKGWWVETSDNQFNSNEALFMDFRVEQKEGLSFVYFLPITERRALIEYTQFTPALLDANEYDLRIQQYIDQFTGLKNFQVVEKEFGIIPMTNNAFPVNEKGVWNIGMAGGQTKASTGYTFQFIQKQSEAVANTLYQNKGRIRSFPKDPGRFHFYDSVLLNVLGREEPGGRAIFTRLFEKNKASDLFRFLDNESSFKQELGIINSLPTWPFTKAAIQEIARF